MRDPARYGDRDTGSLDLDPNDDFLLSLEDLEDDEEADHEEYLDDVQRHYKECDPDD